MYTGLFVLVAVEFQSLRAKAILYNKDTEKKHHSDKTRDTFSQNPQKRNKKCKG